MPREVTTLHCSLAALKAFNPLCAGPHCLCEPAPYSTPCVLVRTAFVNQPAPWSSAQVHCSVQSVWAAIYPFNPTAPAAEPTDVSELCGG